MSDAILQKIRDLIQEDAGQRGLRSDPVNNLITACPDDFARACQSLAETENPAVAVVTGFFIPHAQPPCGETDGPLGAVFLARALVPLGFRVVLATDAFCQRALEVGLASCGLRKAVAVVVLPSPEQAGTLSVTDYWKSFTDRAGTLTHLITLERVGPSHTPESLQARGEPVVDFVKEVPPERHDRCHTMKGLDITSRMSPAHRLFEVPGHARPPLTTIGIGDGGNEIGMGRIPWDVIRRNIPGGAAVACRVPTDQLIVCGVSNWGAYGLAAGVRYLRRAPRDETLFDPDREQALLQGMVERGPLVDGVTGQPTATVDGLSFERYSEVLRALGTVGLE
jgi:hypothetical protein